MAATNQLLRAMVEECRNVIRECAEPNRDLPEALQPKHLQRMCDRMDKHLGDWPTSKLHRWIGFIQGAMMANHMLDLDSVKAMFNKVKKAYGERSEDLIDHLNPDDYFELDIGGEG